MHIFIRKLDGSIWAFRPEHTIPANNRNNQIVHSKREGVLNGYRQQRAKMVTRYEIPGDWNFKLGSVAPTLYIESIQVAGKIGSVV